MESINPYIEFLKEDVLEKYASLDPSINSLSSLSQGKVKNLASSIKNVMVADKAFSEEYGGSISISTLERFLKHGYSANLSDSRTINTLNKLSRYVGYKSWNTYIKGKKRKYKLKYSSLEEKLADVVRNANDAEFNAYKTLPEIQTGELEKYLDIEGTAYKRILNILVRHSKKKWVINNDRNPSGYKCYKILIKSINKNEAIIKTREYWYLRWYSLTENKYRKIYNIENEQTWTLAFDGNSWKVSDTYYPQLSV